MSDVSVPGQKILKTISRKQLEGMKKISKGFGRKVEDLTPSELRTAITGYDLQSRINSLIAGITGKKIKTIFHGDGACTNTTFMILPSIPQMLMFTQEEVMALLGYTAHEISHHLETDFEMIGTIFADIEKPTPEERQLKEWWNAIEDYRIEKITRREFPGFHLYIGAVRHYTAKRFVIAKESDLYTDEDVQNPYKLGAVGLTWIGAILNGYPTAENAKALSLLGEDLRTWLESKTSDLSAVETREEALQLARDIVDELGANNEEKQDKPEESDETGESGNSNNSQDSQENEESETQSPSSSQTDDSSDEEENEGSEASSGQDSSDGEDKDEEGKGSSESDSSSDSEDTDSEKDEQSSEGSNESQSGNPDGDSSEEESNSKSDESGDTNEESTGANEKPDEESFSAEESKNEGDSSESQANDENSPASEKENSEAGEEGANSDGDKSQDNSDKSVDSEQENNGDANSEEEGKEEKTSSQDESESDSSSCDDTESEGDSEKENSASSSENPDNQDKGEKRDSQDASDPKDDKDDESEGSKGSNNAKDDDKSEKQDNAASLNPKSSENKTGGSQAPKTTSEQAKAEPEASDLQIEEILEALSEIAENIDNVMPDIEDGLNTTDNEQVKGSQSLYAEVKRNVGSAGARASGAVRRLLMAQNKTRIRRNVEQGRLDLKRLVPIANGSKNIYYEKSTRKDANSAVSILVDNSGSMSGYPLEICQKAAVVLDTAIHGTNTDLEITGFTGSHCSPKIYVYRKFGQKGQSASASLGNMKNVELGGTPVAVPILDAHKRLRANKAPRKIMIIITDGGAHDAQRAREAYQLAKSTGCIMIGIGIGHQGRYIAEWCDNYELIQNIDDLPKSLTILVQNALMQNKRKAA